MLGKIVLFAMTIAAIPMITLASDLDERLRDSEKGQAEVFHSLQEKSEGGLMTRITARITISGLLEVEAFYENPDLKDGGDVVLATAPPFTGGRGRT